MNELLTPEQGYVICVLAMDMDSLDTTRHTSTALIGIGNCKSRAAAVTCAAATAAEAVHPVGVVPLPLFRAGKAHEGQVDRGRISKSYAPRIETIWGIEWSIYNMRHWLWPDGENCDFCGTGAEVVDNAMAGSAASHTRMHMGFARCSGCASINR
ncbi:hypothetical protein BJ508DRAFT_315895 [Ascobolus immersus RN42]|uniref:Uncharacterized protein n=1 Tax=Ascobolus immersus RN42 TaxID=1160509 RepID=A0A3N4H770_ASCIM|nr:hypothetical protein BJ508DRAFT_316244 [Ascobolus immersus RN42]RPA71131.1 hypothetical protein BJ508DRAFT_315895 [Ascobolus immersus RN42]